MAAHKEGIQVNPWTVDSSIAINTMLTFGADGIITNHPDLTGKLIEKRK